jgi:hypothetical protein
LQLSACLVIAVATATLSLAFKLLPADFLPERQSSSFKDLCKLYRGRNAHDAKFITIQAGGDGWSILLWI